MKPRKSKEMATTLRQKGFQQIEGHHHLFILHVNGIPTSVRTFLSHGAKEYGDNLLAKIKLQMHLQTAQNLDNFFDCPMSAEDYLEILRTNAILPPSVDVSSPETP